ncbi:MAG: GNAT family N-acetyltransferase, partial [Acidiferrobacterales bacterium]
IAALERECFGAVDGVFSRRQLGRLLANPNAFWMLGADGHAVACWLTASNGRARWARLYSLAVHPGLRGQGWGGRLLRAGVAWMRARGLSVCRAEVKTLNHPARQLYARFGFRENGQLPDYYGPGVDGLRLVLQLRTAKSKAVTAGGKPGARRSPRRRRRGPSGPAHAILRSRR